MAIEKGGYAPSVKFALLLAKKLETTVDVLFILEEKDEVLKNYPIAGKRHIHHFDFSKKLNNFLILFVFSLFCLNDIYYQISLI